MKRLAHGAPQAERGAQTSAAQPHPSAVCSSHATWVLWEPVQHGASPPMRPREGLCHPSPSATLFLTILPLTGGRGPKAGQGC